jgi:flagellin-specific chaperone FliS
MNSAAKHDLVHADEAIRVLTTLRDAWAEIAHPAAADARVAR